jgi:hypothetical protein
MYGASGVQRRSWIVVAAASAAMASIAFESAGAAPFARARPPTDESGRAAAAVALRAARGIGVEAGGAEGIGSFAARSLDNIRCSMRCSPIAPMGACRSAIAILAGAGRAVLGNARSHHDTFCSKSCTTRSRWALRSVSLRAKATARRLSYAAISSAGGAMSKRA